MSSKPYNKTNITDEQLKAFITLKAKLSGKLPSEIMSEMQYEIKELKRKKTHN